MKVIFFIVILVTLSFSPEANLPNFGSNKVISEEGFPSPIQESAFVARLTGIYVDYPDLIYISKDNRVVVMDTFNLRILYTIEAGGNIKRVLVEDLENDEIPELIVLTDLKIAVYTNYGNLKWEKRLDSSGMDVGLLRVPTEETYQVVVASENFIDAFSYNGTLLWSEETCRSDRILVTDIDQEGLDEIVIICRKSVETLSHNGSLLWEVSFDKSISVACEFSHLGSILVSLEDGSFYVVDHLGKKSRVGDAKMKTSAIIPLRADMNANVWGFFAVSPSGGLRAYSMEGEIIGNLSRFRNVLSVIPYDLDEQKANACGYGSELSGEEMSKRKTSNKEEFVVVFGGGEIEVLVFCPARSCDQKCEERWMTLPLTYNEESKKEIETGIKDISFAVVFRTEAQCHLFLMSGEGILYKYTIFDWANWFLINYNLACIDFNAEDFGGAYEKLGRLDMKFIEYYGLEKDFEEKTRICEEKVKEERKSAQDLLREGLEEEKKNNTRSALQNLFEARLKFMNANFKHEDIIYEENDIKMTFSDLEKKSVFLCLDLIKNAHEALTRDQYEDALNDFAFLIKYWKVLENCSVSFQDSEEYEEKYLEIRSTYTTSEIQQEIDHCVEEIEKAAIELRSEGKLEESKKKYDFIIEKLKESKEEYDLSTGSLIDAYWPSQTSIERLESDEASVEGLIQEKQKRQTVEVVLILVLIGVIIRLLSNYIRKLLKRRTAKGKLLEELENSKELLENGYVQPAGSLAGAILENALRIIVDENVWQAKMGRDLEEASLGDLIGFLKGQKRISKWDRIQLDFWREMRNHLVHRKKGRPKEHDIDSMIKGIKEFINTEIED